MDAKCHAVAIWFLLFLWYQSRISIRCSSLAFSFFVKTRAGQVRFFLDSLGCFACPEPSQYASVNAVPQGAKACTFLFVSCQISCPLSKLLHDLLPILVQLSNSSFIVRGFL